MDRLSKGSVRRLPPDVDPNRHFEASKLFPHPPFDPSQRWKTLYGIHAHKYISEKLGLERPTESKIWRCPELEITVGYRIDGKKDEVLYEVKEYKHFYRFQFASTIQANLYKFAENCKSCKIVTYRINEKHVEERPSFTIREDTPQIPYSQMIEGLKTFVAPQLRKLEKLSMYA